MRDTHSLKGKLNVKTDVWKWCYLEYRSYIDDKRTTVEDHKSRRFNFVTDAIFPVKSIASSIMELLTLLTPVVQYLSSGTSQENLLKATTGFKGISNRRRTVHKRRVFLVNTTVGGTSSTYWKLKTLQIINFFCSSQVHSAKVNMVKFFSWKLNSRQNYWKYKYYNIRESGQRLYMGTGSLLCMITHM